MKQHRLTVEVILTEDEGTYNVKFVGVHSNSREPVPFFARKVEPEIFQDVQCHEVWSVGPYFLSLDFGSI